MEDRLPLPYQIACLALTALFVWTFSVSRDPRGWRRLFQGKRRSRSTTVNKNKVIDAKLKIWGIRVAMIILVMDVTVFLIGITAPSRKLNAEMTPDEWNRVQELRRFEASRENQFR